MNIGRYDSGTTGKWGSASEWITPPPRLMWRRVFGNRILKVGPLMAVVGEKFACLALSESACAVVVRGHHPVEVLFRHGFVRRLGPVTIAVGVGRNHG